MADQTTPAGSPAAASRPQVGRHTITTRIEGCARCGRGPHIELDFRPLTYPTPGPDDQLFTHWALCPVNGEPILLRVADDEAAPMASPPDANTA